MQCLNVPVRVWYVCSYHLLYTVTTYGGGGDFWTTLWDKIFKLMEIFVVASLEWENVITLLEISSHID